MHYSNTVLRVLVILQQVNTFCCFPKQTRKKAMVTVQRVIVFRETIFEKCYEISSFRNVEAFQSYCLFMY